MIGVLTPRTQLYGPTSTMIAVEVAAREAGYFVSLASVADSSAAALDAAVEHFRDQAVEAVVLIAPEREWLAAARIVAHDLPVVTMSADYRAAKPWLVSVAMDNRAGARLVTRHLLDLGHSDIAFITGPQGLAGGCGEVAVVARRDEKRRPRRIACVPGRLELGDRV